MTMVVSHLRYLIYIWDVPPPCWAASVAAPSLENSPTTSHYFTNVATEVADHHGYLGTWVNVFICFSI